MHAITTVWCFPPQARTDDGMSGADEESSAETASIKSTNSNSSSKKGIKPKKTDKRKSNNSGPPSLRASNAGPTFSLQQQAASSMLSGDNGYVSGGSQGYMSSHTGYLSSSGYDTEHHSIHGEGPEEIARILQEQRLSDPHDMAGSQFIPHSQDLMTSTASHVTSNMKVGRHMMPHPHAHVMASPNQFQPQQLPPSFPSSSQSGFNPTPPQDSSVMFGGDLETGAMGAHLSPHQMHALPGADINSPFLGSGAPHPNGKTSRTSSSGYSSFRSSSPNKHLVGNVARKSPTDDGSVNCGSSLRSSLMTNSYSTFSSNSSRVSSPSSTSGRGGGGPHPPHSPLHNQFMHPNILAMTPHTQHLQANIPSSTGGAAHFDMMSTDTMAIGYPLKHSLRMSNSYPQKQTCTGSRRNSQDSYDSQSDATSRSWQYSSQSSRYSFARSELSDEQIEKLPTFRRDSFSKNQPLPLPESMQQDFSPLPGMGMEFEQNGTLGMDFISTNTDPQSEQSQPSPMQLNVSDHPPTSTTSHVHVSTLPLHHLDQHHSANSSLSPASRSSYASQVGHTQGMMFSQDSGINDEGLDMFFGGHGTNLRTMSMSPNMALGDMASFANSLPEETQYLEQLLTNQVK